LFLVLANLFRQNISGYLRERAGKLRSSLSSDPEYIVIIFAKAICVLQSSLRFADATYTMHSARVLAGFGINSTR
jgi:hypothetical protein